MSIWNYLQPQNTQQNPVNNEQKPGFFDGPVTKKIWNVLSNPMESSSKAVNWVGNSILNSKFMNDTLDNGFWSTTKNRLETAPIKLGNWLMKDPDSTINQMVDRWGEAEKTMAPGDNIDALVVPPAKALWKYIGGPIVGGGMAIGRTVQQGVGDAGNKLLGREFFPDARPPEWEKNALHYDAQPFQETYFKYASDFADSQGSGGLEKGALMTLAGVGGFAVESPLGAPAKRPIKPLIKNWLTTKAGKEEIFEGLAGLGLRPDAQSELTDSIWMHIHESTAKQGQRAVNIERVINFVLENERRLPPWLPENSVLQYVDPVTGEGVFFRVSPEDLRVLAEDVIDGTSRGVAGKNIAGKIYHLTAKTPTQMLERAGWKDGGTKALEEVLEMIKPPKIRQTLRNADGTFAGSKMVDDSTAYKLAADELKAERDLADQLRAFKNEEDFIAAVDSIAGRVKKFSGGDKKIYRQNVSRIEDRFFKSVKRFLDEPGLKTLKKEPEQILRDFYQRVNAPGYKRPTLNELAIDRSFQEVSRGLERIFGTRVPIYEIPRMTRGGAVVEGVTTRLGDRTVIGLFRKAGTFDQAVANHEGWHWFKRNLSDAKRKELDELELEYAAREPERIEELKQVYEKQPGQSDAAYEKMLREELMADEFARYYETGQTTWQKVKNFFDDAFAALESVFGVQRDIMDRVGQEFRGVKKTLRKDAGPDTTKATESLKQIADKETMATVHNLSEDNILAAERLGGIANPSVATVNTENFALDGFGEITLIAPPELLTSRGAQRYASDVYTPRFPRDDVVTSVDWKKVKAFEEANGVDLHSTVDFERFYDRAEYNSDILDLFRKETGKLPGESPDAKAEFNDWIRALGNELGVKERIFKGFTPSGTRRYSDLTLENASKEMRQRGVQGAESWFYGLGTIRSMLSPRFKDLKAMKKAKDKLVSSKDFDKIKEPYEKEFDEIIRALMDEPSRKSWGSFTDGGELLGEYYKGNRNAFNEWIPDMSPELLKRIDDFGKELGSMPTEYFETKFTRPVAFSEFSHALVPENTSKRVIDVLEKNGIVVKKYKKGDEAGLSAKNRQDGRLAAMQELIEEVPGIAFKKTRPEPKSRRIKIDAEIKEIRKAINSKEYNAEQVGELGMRIDMIEEALPDVQDIRRVAGFKKVGDDTLSQIQATAQKKMETNDLAKSMTITEAVKVLGNQSKLVNGKRVPLHNAKTLEAARIKRRANLDDFVTQYGFDDLDAAQEAIEQFDRAKAEISILRESLQQSRGERALANKASAVASAVSAERRAYVRELQDQFQLSDADIKKISFGRDLQRMGESEFKGFINKMEQRAIEVANTRQAKWELMAQLEDMHFEKVDNYRRAKGFPPISQMNETQLRQYSEMLMQFQPGDQFLTPRTLEVIGRSDLGDVSTMREVREQLWEKMKDDPDFKGMKLEDLEGMQASVVDNMRYDTALAEKNPFYKLLVTKTQSEMMRAKGAALKVREEINRLTRAANASRKRGVVGRIKQALIPQQKEVIAYLEATPAQKAAAAEKLTKEELELAAYMENYYSNALDHLVSIQELRGSRYEDAYFTHTRKRFLEKWSDDGLINAIKDVFQAQKDQAAVARIIDQDTGQILSKSKFFKYTLRRSGDIDPSQNATDVFMNYVDQFERKKALDNIIPELEVYTQALTPKGTTKKGLELDRSLKTFVNKYLNNKKARRENFGGLLEQGGKLDVGLRMGNTFVSLLDLGGNIFASTATIIGEGVMTTQALGFGGMAKGIKRRLWDTGVKRITNPKVKDIFKEAEPFLGRNFWSEIADPNIGITDRALTGIFAPFSQSSVEMNKLFLLSKLTKEELAAGKLSPKRLAELRLEAGRWRDMGSEVKSIYGSTSAGATVNKYKGWAIPIARTNIDNINKLIKGLRSRSAKETITSREFQETLRAVEITMAVYLIGNHVMTEENDDSFLGKLYARAEMEAMTIMGGIDPTVFVSVPRLATFLEQLAANMKSLVTLEQYKSSGKDYEYGDLKGLKRLQRQFTPAALRQFNLDEEAAKKTDFKNKVFNKIIEMEPAEAEKAVAALSEEEWEMYKTVRSSWRAANTRETRGLLSTGDLEGAVKYVQSLPEAEANRIVNVLTDEEYELYQEGKGMVKSPIQQESLMDRINIFN